MRSPASAGGDHPVAAPSTTMRLSEIVREVWAFADRDRLTDSEEQRWQTLMLYWRPLCDRVKGDRN